MENPNQNNDLLAQHRPKSLPAMLNVLTILTFIGCGLGLLSSGWNFISSSSDQIEKLQEQREKMSEQTGFAKKFFDDSFDIAQVGFDHKNLLLVVGLIGLVLCLIGAIQMRKLKRSGFFMYTIGELAPIFVLGGLLTSITNINFLFSVFFSFLFVILYATQLKHLVNK
ncbi:MAG TPA: hypothetical protein VL095_08295 [Flavisolibacter sp.]|nr:hypothetical protein [Flavisolibacter sp.]